MKKNIEKSQSISRAIKAKNGQCWNNALLAMLLYPNSALYVEGFVMYTPLGFPVHHGWVELDGEIIELTPIWVDSSSSNYHPITRNNLNDLLAYKNLPLSFCWHHVFEKKYKELLESDGI